MSSINTSYVKFSKCHFNNIKLNIGMNLLNKAISMNRYYNVYSCNNSVKYEGIDPLYGPNNFVMPEEEMVNMDVNLLHYETFLIFPQLKKINQIMEKFNIRTIQSQPSYYINLNSSTEEFNSYFNVPFVEFIGNYESMNIFETIKRDCRLNDCYFDNIVNYSKTTMSLSTIRFCIMRPFINSNGDQINGFDDTDFWNTIIEIISEL